MGKHTQNYIELEIVMEMIIYKKMKLLLLFYGSQAAESNYTT
jgi:hypothetical protein